tara:strand:- start:41 stop:523 length:483 start_codon:yes stop_codon:yes gene_type:complete
VGKMSKRPHMKTTKKQIVDWGIKNIDECDYGVDASEMDTHCWRCGHETPDVERCHVIPYSLGGKDEASNYRLFCYSCHIEQPNVNDYGATDEWVRRTNVGTYNTFWKVRKIYNSLWKDVTNHWGQDLNESTKKWMSKEFIKRLTSEGIWVTEKTLRCISG